MAWKIDKEVFWHALFSLPSQLYHSFSRPAPFLLATKSTAGAARVVVDDMLLLVLPGERPRWLEVQALLVALVVVGAATGRQLVLRELLTDDATWTAAAATAASSTTTDATTFKLCLDANFGAAWEKLHDERHVILHGVVRVEGVTVWVVNCFRTFCLFVDVVVVINK